jgi:hypothetical protein
MSRGARQSASLSVLLIVCAALGCGDDSDVHARDAAAGRPGSDEGSGTHDVDHGERATDAAAMDAGDAASDARDAEVPDASEPTAQAPALPPCDDRFGLLRVAGWPGGGAQLALALSANAGEPSLARKDGAGELSSELHAQPQTSGLTLLAIVPSSDAQEQALRLSAARALIGALPVDERIAVAVMSAGSPLAADLTEQRAHVLARIDALAPAEPVADAQLAADFTQLAERLRQVFTAWGPLARSAVLIGAALPDGGSSLVAGDEDAGAGGDASLRVRAGVLQASLIAPEQRPATASAAKTQARALAQRIAEQRERIVLLGACGSFAAGEVLTLALGDLRCDLPAPAPIAEHVASVCDASAAAADAYPFADTIEIVLTDEERALHDEYSAAQSEDVFSAHVVLGTSAAIEATAHFRGQTSLNCDRKNYSINLKGPEPRRIAPGIANDEFYLISMCKDESYFLQLVASEMMRPLGIYPLVQRYVRLRVAGEERGVYLLIEKPEEAAISSRLAPSAVVRRRFEAQKKAPDIKFPDDPDGAELARTQYEALAALVDQVEPDVLGTALDEQMDFEGYLRWLAINSYLQCGDSADEMFFYASNESGAPNGGPYFRIHGWDSDDLFEPCHHSGGYAMNDPAGVAYCAESRLDRALLVSDAVEAHYVDVLDEVMTDAWPATAVDALLDQTRAQLFAQLQDESVCAAMSELIAIDPEAAQCARARADIDDAFSLFRDKLAARSALLRDAIAAWRSTR